MTYFSQPLRSPQGGLADFGLLLMTVTVSQGTLPKQCSRIYLTTMRQLFTTVFCHPPGQKARAPSPVPGPVGQAPGPSPGGSPKNFRARGGNKNQLNTKRRGPRCPGPVPS